MGICTTVKLRDGRTFAVMCDGNEVTIGRDHGNDVPLMHRLVSKRHTRIVLRDGKLIVVDLKSTNGTFVNGKRMSSPQVLKDNDKIYIGDFTITVGTEAVAGALPAHSAPSWAGTDSAGEATAIAGVATEAPAPTRSPSRATPEGDDDATPPVGTAPSPTRPGKNDEPALLLQNETTGAVHMAMKFGITIGRAVAAGLRHVTAPGVQVDSPLVSPEHARITHEGVFVLRDLASASGTFVVDIADIARRFVGGLPLSNGTRFRVGEHTFVVLHVGTAQSATQTLHALQRARDAARTASIAATTPSPRAPATSPSATKPKGRTVIDDDAALGVAPAVRSAAEAPVTPAKLEARVGGVSVGALVRDDGLSRTSHGRAAGRDARITQLSVNLRSGDEFEAMFRDMTKLVSLFQSPRLPRMLASDPGLLATSPPPGTLLDTILAAHTRIPPHVAVYITIECARVLADFHDVKNDTGAPLQPVLRKLSTKTVEIARDGSVQLADFILAKSAATWRETDTASGVIKGDFPTMSPEQAKGMALDARSDVWALGVLLHTMVEGANPFATPGASAFEVIERIVKGRVPPLADAPAPLQEALDVLLTNNPAERAQSARDAITLLESVALTLPPASRLDVERLLR